MVKYFFGIISFISLLVGFLSFRAATKQKKIYNYLFNLAEKNIDKDITEERLNKKKKEVENFSAQISKLQEKIRKDIPKEARKAVLKDRLNSEIDLLKKYYDSSQILKTELALLGESPEIPHELMKAIEREISPEYILRERRSTLKSYLSMVTAGAAISSTILPDFFSRFVSVPLLLIGVLILFLLLRASLPLNKKARKKIVFKFTSIGLLLIGVFSLAISFIFVFLAINARYDQEEFFIATLFFILTGTITTLSGIIIAKKKNIKIIPKMKKEAAEP